MKNTRTSLLFTTYRRLERIKLQYISFELSFFLSQHIFNVPFPHLCFSFLPSSLSSQYFTLFYFHKRPYLITVFTLSHLFPIMKSSESKIRLRTNSSSVFFSCYVYKLPRSNELLMNPRSIIKITIVPSMYVNY